MGVDGMRMLGLKEDGRERERWVGLVFMSFTLQFRRMHEFILLSHFVLCFSRLGGSKSPVCDKNMHQYMLCRWYFKDDIHDSVGAKTGHRPLLELDQRTYGQMVIAYDF